MRIRASHSEDFRTDSEDKMIIVVTPHQAFVDYCLEKKIIEEGKYKLLPRVQNYDEIRNQDVVGILPLHLACLCNTVTEIPMVIPSELRGTRLTIEQIRDFAKKPKTYIVDQVDEEGNSI